MTDLSASVHTEGNAQLPFNLVGEGVTSPTSHPVERELEIINDVEKKANRDTSSLDTWESSAIPGLTFKIVKVARFLLYEILRNPKLQDPKPPMYMNDTKGRIEENPLDPDYQTALIRAGNDRALALNNVVVGFGTRILTCPDSIPSVDSDDWIVDLAEMGIPIVTRGKGRYVAWVKFVALPDETEFFSLRNKASSFSGLLMEEEVAEAEATFSGS